MTMNKTHTYRKYTAVQKIGVAGMTAALATLLGLPVYAASNDFPVPSNPLLTGGNAVPPNILMSLDDSGSMNFIAMPKDVSTFETSYQGTQRGLRDDPTDRSYVHNTLYYNPRVPYLPWRTSSVNLGDRLPAANFWSAASHTTSYNSSPVDLRTRTSDGIRESYFYVPRTGIANPGTDPANYDKYRIAVDYAGEGFNQGVVQKRSQPNRISSGKINGIPYRTWSQCVSVSTAGYEEAVIETWGGEGNGNLYVYGNGSCWGEPYAGSQNGGNSETVNYPSPPATISFRVYAMTAVKNMDWQISGYAWNAATPTGRNQAGELQNFANWYQYHRTRNKMAKAGASEAFGRLGTNYRVGFDTIWNRGGTNVDTAGDVPAYPIPWATNDGRFSGGSRSGFYSQLQGAGANGGTPLKGALQRAARYFMTDDPWKDSDGTAMTCRQNYAILTTDGYWNDNSGYTSVGNADAAVNTDVDGNPPPYPDGYSDTLADVAYKYWSTDLKTGPNWPNNVLTSAANPADWQHMVTFGVSIGLQGTLNPNNPPPRPWTIDPISNSGKERIDDLWHAALNSRGKFVVAGNTDQFASALIDALATIDSRSASGSNIASSSTRTDAGTLTFVAGFTSGSWVGDLIASPFNAALTGVSSQPKWILSKTFPGVTDTGDVYPDVNANFAARPVLTMKDGTAAMFGAGSGDGMVGVADFAARTGETDEVSAADNIAYLRGDQSKEQGQVNGTLRKRAWPIGDIVNSSPVYVEEGTTRMVYIGANDGMLHGINADTGQVRFSYVPKGIDFKAMASLSSTSYSHRYFVDGQIDVSKRASRQGNSKNILVGALGRGGRGVFALDVTNPGAMSKSQVLWDHTTQDTTTDPNMGYVLGAVRIRKGNGDKTYALVPNGINSPNGSATLFVYELDSSGGIVRTLPLVADGGGANGLMSLGLADLNSDGNVDVVYGGDMKGNIYRWDFSGNVDLATNAVKLFQATDSGGVPQPITGGIGVGRDRLGNIFLGFGTGRFILSSDVPGVAAQQVQSIYGIRDEATTITGRSQLQQRTIPFSGTTSSGDLARGFEKYSPLPQDKKGWYIDLVTPERVISAPTIYGTAMILSSVIPATGSDCAGAGGSGFLNAINLFTGTSPESESYFGDGGTVTDADGNEGVLGSVGVIGGMPTEANVTTGLATIGTGAFSTEDCGEGGCTKSEELGAPPGGAPGRVNWREVVPTN